ncbi:hypothetical protein SAMN02745166_02228 [Prosthecobacter debontii]|uniref:Terminase-like family protein n=1 Tax=Prosthecobacter debontii TaxID=48467 RepID=A0A1T4XZB1_9BACT|nr:hypothetical protein [Prosthecobacter debontii]SKA94879.1 hypothetical protein SAMN02745166_02228 [Prosthecobacter debontii]
MPRARSPKRTASPKPAVYIPQTEADLAGPPLDPKVKEKLALLQDRNWRLENLYLILVQGQPVPFQARPEQLQFRRHRHRRNFVPKARKLGISTEIVLENGDECVFSPNFKSAIIDETEVAAWEKLEIFRFAWLNGPNHPDPFIAALWRLIQAANPLLTNNHSEMAWANGSSYQAGTSFTGRTPQRLHVSEFGPICDASLEKGRKIRRGSINAVLPEDIVDVETTMRGGRVGPCYELFRLAKESVGRPLTSGDWRLHFFSWLQHPDYRLLGQEAHNAEVLRYFKKLREEHALDVPPERQAWYEKKRREQGDDMLQEFPTTIEECDQAIVLGAIYPQMASVRAQGRVREFNPEPHLPLYTFWDCGGDSLAGWLVQPTAKDINILDWAAGEGGGAAGLVAQVRRWEALHGPIAKNYVPHDAHQRDKGSNKTFYTQMLEAGLQPNQVCVVSRIPDVWTGIGYLRRLLPQCWFHRRCDAEPEAAGDPQPSGIARLENYRRALNKTTGHYLEHPLKDGLCDHTADALRTFAEASALNLIPTQSSATARGRSRTSLDDDDDDLGGRGTQRRGRREVARFGFVGR